RDRPKTGQGGEEDEKEQPRRPERPGAAAAAVGWPGRGRAGICSRRAYARDAGSTHAGSPVNLKDIGWARRSNAVAGFGHIARFGDTAADAAHANWPAGTVDHRPRGRAASLAVQGPASAGGTATDAVHAEAAQAV